MSKNNIKKVGPISNRDSLKSHYDRCIFLAREFYAKNELVEAERLMQSAEHFFHLLVACDSKKNQNNNNAQSNGAQGNELPNQVNNSKANGEKKFSDNDNGIDDSLRREEKIFYDDLREEGGDVEVEAETRRKNKLMPSKKSRSEIE